MGFTLDIRFSSTFSSVSFLPFRSLLFFFAFSRLWFPLLPELCKVTVLHRCSCSADPLDLSPAYTSSLQTERTRCEECGLVEIIQLILKSIYQPHRLHPIPLKRQSECVIYWSSSQLCPIRVQRKNDQLTVSSISALIFHPMKHVQSCVGSSNIAKTADSRI